MRQATRRTRSVIGTERILVMGRPRRALDGWCSNCAELVRLVRPEEAANLAACMLASSQPLHAEKLHLVGTPEGLMYVCLNSLLNQN